MGGAPRSTSATRRDGFLASSRCRSAELHETAATRPATSPRGTSARAVNCETSTTSTFLGVFAQQLVTLVVRVERSLLQLGDDGVSALEASGCWDVASVGSAPIGRASHELLGESGTEGAEVCLSVGLPVTGHDRSEARPRCRAWRRGLPGVSTDISTARATRPKRHGRRISRPPRTPGCRRGPAPPAARRRATGASRWEGAGGSSRSRSRRRPPRGRAGSRTARPS